MATTTFSGPVISQNGFEGQAVLTEVQTTGEVRMNGTSIIMTGLPTADPGVAGQLWVDTSAANVLKVSQG